MNHSEPLWLYGTEEGFCHRKILNFTPAEYKRVFGVDLDECHTRIHIVDL